MIYNKSTIKGVLNKVLRESGAPIAYSVENVKIENDYIDVEYRVNPKLNRLNRQTLYKSDVAKEFVTRKQQAAKTLLVHRVKQDYYLVENFQKQTMYLVHHINRLDFICNCPDYQNMKNHGLDHPVCKHGYAVLNSMGYESLQDYLNH
jgi:uncharacterized Zn finger protein